MGVSGWVAQKALRHIGVRHKGSFLPPVPRRVWDVRIIRGPSRAESKTKSYKRACVFSSCVSRFEEGMKGLTAMKGRRDVLDVYLK